LRCHFYPGICEEEVVSVIVGTISEHNGKCCSKFGEADAFGGSDLVWSQAVTHHLTSVTGHAEEKVE
jgi:hypothetical protein